MGMGYFIWPAIFVNQGSRKCSLFSSFVKFESQNGDKSYFAAFFVEFSAYCAIVKRKECYLISQNFHCCDDL